MPKSTVETENPHKLPTDTYFAAKLVHVEEKRHEFTYKKGEKAGQKDVLVKWIWDYLITAGEFSGLHARGETDPKVTVFPDGAKNVPAQWVESLRDMEVSFGEAIDTDDYDGLGCVITVSHAQRERGDGQGIFYSEPVKDVYPERLLADLQAGVSHSAEDPPF